MHEEGRHPREDVREVYGSQPDAASSINTIFPGYGAPDFKNYDPKPHELACKETAGPE